jgi:hypothetical protein
VERRKQPRIKLETNLTIEILGDHPATYEGSNKIPGLMVDVSTDGMRFLSPVDIAPGTAIRIDRDTGMILGEVCYTESHGEQFHLGILFRQVLANLRDLEPLLRTLQSYEEDARNRNSQPKPTRS